MRLSRGVITMFSPIGPGTLWLLLAAMTKTLTNILRAWGFGLVENRLRQLQQYGSKKLESLLRNCTWIRMVFLAFIAEFALIIFWPSGRSF